MYKPKLENFKMATAKKVSKAEKIRAYQVKHPNATASQVAKATSTDIGYVYALRHSDRKTPEVVKFMGVTMAKDDVAKLTEEQTARLIFNNTQGRQRMRMQEDDTAEPVDNVNHPPHYKVGGIETIDFIEAKGLSYHLGNVVKYIARADSKGNREEDLLKARWYLNREIAKFTKEQA
jgi:hypothetical protein